MQITMGIQTGSERFRKEYYGRHDTNEDITRAAELLAKYRINHAFDIILDNPLETEADHRETFELLLRLPRPYDLHMHTLTHFPDTELTNRLLAGGHITPGDIEDQKKESYERWTPMDLRRPQNSLYWIRTTVKKLSLARDGSRKGFLSLWLIFFAGHPLISHRPPQPRRMKYV